MGAVRFGQELRAFLKGPLGEFDIEHITGDPSGAAEAQTDERTIFQVLEGAGIRAAPAHSNDFTLRREAVAAPLSRIVDGEPGLLVHPDCRVLRKGMAGGYRFRRVAVRGTERYQDAPEKNFYSHVADASQYLMLGSGEGRALVRPKSRGDRQRFALTANSELD
jgi:hypothetical protein